MNKNSSELARLTAQLDELRQEADFYRMQLAEFDLEKPAKIEKIEKIEKAPVEVLNID